MALLNLFTMFVGLVWIVLFIIGHSMKWMVLALWIVLQGCGRAYGGYLQYKINDEPKKQLIPRVVLPIVVMDVVLVAMFMMGVI